MVPPVAATIARSRSSRFGSFCGGARWQWRQRQHKRKTEGGERVAGSTCWAARRVARHDAAASRAGPHLKRHDAAAVGHQRRQVRGLVARRRARVHQRPPRLRRQRVGGHAGGLALQHQSAAGHQRVVVQVGGGRKAQQVWQQPIHLGQPALWWGERVVVAGGW